MSNTSLREAAPTAYLNFLLYERLCQRLCSAQVAQYNCPIPHAQ
ncbi:MAG: hypothetical protein RMX65_024510 [Nostoc sp. DedQUE01]